MDLVSDHYLDGGVVSKALTWSSQSTPPAVKARVPKPFRVDRINLKKTSFTLPVFRFDPKDAQSSRTVDCADTEVQTDLLPSYTKPIYNLATMPVRLSKPAPGNENFPKVDDYGVSDSPDAATRAARLGIITRDLPRVSSSQLKVSFGDDIVPLTIPGFVPKKKKFLLPSVEIKWEKPLPEDFLVRIVSIQARWRGSACRRKLRLARTVHSIFDIPFS